MDMNRFSINKRSRIGALGSGLISREEYQSVNAAFDREPKAQATPLHRLRSLAAELKVAEVWLKDESVRFGLNSFKILGVSYAIARLFENGLLTPDSVLACATEGNHGRAVARVARDRGLKAHIYVSADMAAARVQAMDDDGAKVTRVDGSYDEAVTRAALDAKKNGWQVILDTSWEGYESIPRSIVAGYTRLMDEVYEQVSPEPEPDIVIVQAGVGGLACAALSWLLARFGERRPKFIVCEPLGAASLLESHRAGKMLQLDGPFETIMAGLRSGRVSPITWPVLSSAVDAFVAVDDERAKAAMRRLASPRDSDPVVVAGASGASGVGALYALMQDDAYLPVRVHFGLNETSRVLLINTEGATDPVIYENVVGRELSTGI